VVIDQFTSVVQTRYAKIDAMTKVCGTAELLEDGGHGQSEVCPSKLGLGLRLGAQLVLEPLEPLAQRGGAAGRGSSSSSAMMRAMSRHGSWRLTRRISSV